MSIRTPRQMIGDLKQAYRDIAKDFSHTRQHPWPEFKIFAEAVPDGAKVLDLGCGNGRFLEYLLQQQRLVDYVGVDFCPELLDLAKKKYPSQEFVEQDITQLDLGRKFDRIACIAAFHHIPSTKLRNKTLRLFFDHLEDDGLLLLSVWNLWQWKYAPAFIRSFFCFFISGFSYQPRDLFIPFGKKKVRRYYYAFIPYELKRLLRKNGFVVEASQVSRHNYLFICRKNLLSARGNPLFVRDKNLETNWGKAPVASFLEKI